MTTIAVFGYGRQPDDWRPVAADRHWPRLIVPPAGWDHPGEPTGAAEPDWLADADVVYIGGPLARRAEVGRWAARPGQALFVELPVAPDPAALAGFAAAVQAAGSPLTVVARLRHQPFALGMHQALDQGKLGAVRFAHLTLIEGLATTTLARPPALPLDQVANALDLLTWLVGDTVSSVFARRTEDTTGPSSDIVSVIVQYDGGAQAICEVGRAPGLDAIGWQRVQLIGERGALWHDRHRGDQVIGQTGGQPLTDHRLTPLLARLAQPPPAPTGLTLDECQRNLALALAVGESLRQGQPVTIGGPGHDQ